MSLQEEIENEKINISDEIQKQHTIKLNQVKINDKSFKLININNNLKRKLDDITNSLNKINQDNSEYYNKLYDSMQLNKNHKNQIINSNNDIKLLTDNVDKSKKQITDIKNDK